VKYFRIKKNADFQKIFKKGKKVFSPYLSLLYFPSEKTSMGLVVSKKHGGAVVRNRIKRQLRAAFYNNCDLFEKSVAVIIIPKVREDKSYLYKDFEKSLICCIKKVNGCRKS